MYASAWATGETLALSAAKRRGRRSPTFECYAGRGRILSLHWGGFADSLRVPGTRPRRRRRSNRTSRRGCRALGLEQGDRVPVWILEPRRLPDAATRSDRIDSLERREVVLLEDDTPLLQLLDVGGDVARPEPHLRMVGLVRVAAPVDEESGAIPALEHEVVLDRFRGQPQPDLLLVELLAPDEIGRAENRRDSVVRYHVAHLQGLR